MMRSLAWQRICLGCMILWAVVFGQCRSADHRGSGEPLGQGELRIGLQGETGLPSVINSTRNGRRKCWLLGPVRLTVKDEASLTEEMVTAGRVCEYADRASVAESRVDPSTDRAGAQAELASLGVALSHRMEVAGHRAVWEMTFVGDGGRRGHEITLDLPVLFPGAQLFTPSQYGVLDVDAYPTFAPVPYGSYDWNGGQAYVLPLVTVMDPGGDHGLTLALPPDRNIPHLQVAWSGARVLTLKMGHRGIGGGRPTTIRLLVYAHPADYRSALKVYADDFPAYFRPPLPRGPYEGTFWYHHIHEHPDFEEMARQHVRYTWTSFWFTHMGEFLPDGDAWYPYTYARWWNFERKMDDEVISAFIRKMHGRGIGSFAYFNVTEYGGKGGRLGDKGDADRLIEERFAPALVRNAAGRTIPTWEGSQVINPGRRYPYRSHLMEQARRHIDRIPELDGFIVDRLDWASGFDYGHDDGLSMAGDRPLENLAVPVADALQDLCRTAHEAGKRVYVNQFWRVELLRDVDGYCHENDYLPAMAYLAPYRPASAWHLREGYTGDLLPFEAQLKRRLHWALFPQMIAHTFPICQQNPDARAADIMELFAPLFEPLLGKEQVLLPHCVTVTGPNDANLFRNGEGHYVAPVTSRVRFLCRPPCRPEQAALTLRVPDAGRLAWARVFSADGPPYRAPVEVRKGRAVVTLERHGASSMVVIGKEPEPSLETGDALRLDALRKQSFPDPGLHDAPIGENTFERPEISDITDYAIEVSCIPVGVSQPPTVVDVRVDGREVGRIRDGGFMLAGAATELPLRPPVVSLIPGDEGTWMVPDRVDYLIHRHSGARYLVASWETGDPCGSEGNRGIRLPLKWRKPSPVIRSTARFEGKHKQTAGSSPGRAGGVARWLPGARDQAPGARDPVAPEEDKPSGFGLKVLRGESYVWAEDGGGDDRVLRQGSGGDAPMRAACWYDIERLEIHVTPPDRSPYRLTVYLLDYDRNGRAEEVAVLSGRTVLDKRDLSPLEMEEGLYLSWIAEGPIVIRVRRTEGANAVLSGVFVDNP